MLAAYAGARQNPRRDVRPTHLIPVTNPLERLNKEVKRRADVVGIFPSEPSILRPIGAVLLEANDEWQLQHRYMQVEAMAELVPPLVEIEGEVTPAHASAIKPQAA